MKQNSKTLGVASVLVILSVLSIGVVWLLTGDKKGGGKAMGYVQKAPQLNGKAHTQLAEEERQHFRDNFLLCERQQPLA